MFTMDQILLIRRLYYVQGKNLSEIAAVVDCDWRTARKYVDKEDFNPRGKDPQNKGPILTNWIPKSLRLTNGFSRIRSHSGNSGKRPDGFTSA